MSNGIKVTVKSTAKDFEPRTFEFSEDSTVGDLRKKVAETISAETPTIRLILNASILNDDNVLLTKLPNITQDTVIFTQAKARGKVLEAPLPSSSPAVRTPQPRQAEPVVPQEPHPSAQDGLSESSSDDLELNPAGDNSNLVEQLVETFSCGQRLAQLSLELANNNVDLAAAIIGEEPTEEELENTLRHIAGGRHRHRPHTYSNEELERMLQEPNFLEMFTTHISDWSPNLALRFNNDHDLLLEVLHLYLNMVEASMAGRGVPAPRDRAPPRPAGPPQPPPLTAEDEDNIATIIGICGGDLNYNRVKEAYVRLGRNMDAVVSVIMDQREYFERE